MPANQFNVGRDVTLDIVDPVEGALRFQIKTGWTASPQYDDLESKALDGVPRFDNIPKGHKLTMTFDRADPNVDRYFANREARYFANQAYTLATITETIRNVGGSTSVYRYTGVSLKQAESAWKGNSITTGQIEGMAARKIQIR